MGKGSRPRPYSVSQDTFANNYDAIFGRKDRRVIEDAISEDEEFNNLEKKMQVKVEENKDKIGQCGCGRSPTGKCIGWHGLSEQEFKEKLEEYKLNEGL